MEKITSKRNWRQAGWVVLSANLLFFIGTPELLAQKDQVITGILKSGTELPLSIVYNKLFCIFK